MAIMVTRFICKQCNHKFTIHNAESHIDCPECGSGNVTAIGGCELSDIELYGSEPDCDCDEDCDE